MTGPTGPIIPSPPADVSGPWYPPLPGEPPVDPETPPEIMPHTLLAELPALMGTTTGGLPNPESSDALNQGANAIKALALAIEARGGGFGTWRLRSQLNFNGGRPPGIAIPAGFKAIGGILLTSEWGGNGPAVPAIISVETPVTTVTNLGLLAYTPPIPGGSPTSATWYTGLCWVSILVWGPIV